MHRPPVIIRESPLPDRSRWRRLTLGFNVLFIKIRDKFLPLIQKHSLLWVQFLAFLIDMTYHFLYMLRIGQNLQASVMSIRKHLLRSNLIPFEKHIVNVSAPLD